MTDYIITEEQLQKLVKNGVSHASEQIAYTVLSNPFTAKLQGGRKSIASFAGVPPSKREFEIRAAVLDEQEPSYEDLVDFARWTQTLWKNGIDIMRRNHLAIESDEPMQKLAFTFYSDLCEIDVTVRHLFEEGYGDKNYKDETVIPVDLSKYPTEQDIRRGEREKTYKKTYKKLKKLSYLIWQSPQSYGQKNVVNWSDIDRFYKNGVKK